MKTKSITIATRKSKLALWQANFVKKQLETLYPNLSIKLLELSTKGDRILDTSLAKIGGKGLFVKELEMALLDGRADLAVHSMKDMPAEQPNGLSIEVICERAEPWDCFVSKHAKHFSDLPANAIIGTSSIRRQSQLKALRPDLQFKDLRGNVNTRLAKLDNGEYDAIILASAGLKRLGLTEFIQHNFRPDELLPAAAQGAIGIECRSDAIDIIELIKPLNHHPTTACALAERTVTKLLDGSCQAPIAAHAEIINQRLSLQGKVLSPNGEQIIEAQLSGPFESAVLLGETVAKQLIADGAKGILDKL